MWDTHCHLTIEPAMGLSEKILRLSRERSIKLSVCAVELNDYIALKEMKLVYPENIYHLGLHPWAITNDTNIEEASSLIVSELSHFDGLGEIGLDFLRGNNTRAKQMAFLEELVKNLKYNSKPLVYHCVKAHSELLSLDHTSAKSIIHGFYGSAELAKRYLDKGFYFSLGHLYLNSKKDELLRYIPLDRMLVETDSPSSLYKSPHNSELGFRSPLDIESIYSYFCKVLDITKDELILNVNKNMKHLYEKS